MAERIYLSSPTMHGEEMTYIREAFETNWMSTVGKNIDEIERIAAEVTGNAYAVALVNGTAALHLALRMAGERAYGAAGAGGTLRGNRVFCSDMTFDASANPIAYEGGEAVFIDAEAETWNMDPVALEKAFQRYPEVKIVVAVHLYGTPAKIDRIREFCDAHGALLVEDAAESLGASYKGKQTGSFGDFNIISFNGNKIITGSSGGMFLTDDEAAAKSVRKWSTQARDDAPWYQHSELGYNYRMSNVIAGIVRGQFPHLAEHIAQKKAIYERYREGLRGLPLRMNPVCAETCEANYWLSCILIDEAGMCEQRRTEHEASFVSAPGKSCPAEIMEALAAENIESRPIWKPMHLQPIYAKNAFVTAASAVKDNAPAAVDEDIFERGLCLPSDNKMTPEIQAKVIDILRGCFA